MILESASTYRCVECELINVFDSILYQHNIFGNYTYSMHTKMGGTLPVLKNEIEDFFFARLGTGRTSQRTSRYDAYINIYTKKNRLYRFFNKQRNLRGIFDEKRLDEIFQERGFFDAFATSYISSTKKEPAFTGSYVTLICEHILMRNG